MLLQAEASSALLFLVVVVVVWIVMIEDKKGLLKRLGRRENGEYEQLEQTILHTGFKRLQTLQRIRHSRIWLFFPSYLLSIDLIACTFFLCLYAIRNVAPWTVPAVAHIFSLLLYLLLAAVAIIAIRHCPRNIWSALVVFTLALTRAIASLLSVTLSEGHTKYIPQALLDSWGYFLTIYTVSIMAHELLPETQETVQSDNLESSEKGDNNPATSIYYLECAPAEKSVWEEPLCHTTVALENLCIALLLICCLAMSMFVVLPEWENENMWVTMGFDCSLWFSASIGFSLVLLVANKLVVFYFRENGKDRVNCYYVILAVVVASVLLRLIVDVGMIISDIGRRQYFPYVDPWAFISYGKDTFTHIIPLIFYFSTIIDYVKSTITSKWMIYAILLNVHLVPLGLLLEVTSDPLALSAARGTILLICFNFCCITLNSLWPLRRISYLLNDGK